MRVFGLDFTSAPGRKKPITCAVCEMIDEQLRVRELRRLTDFGELEEFLSTPGPWIAGFDFPFGQPRKLIDNLRWPAEWEKYVERVAGMSKAEFEDTLARYRNARPAGDKQHLRAADVLAHSRSPMMLYGVPVGKMFFYGAPLLLRSGASILPCRPQRDPRLIVEAYPALVVRALIGKRSYKNDARSKQTPEREAARSDIIVGLRSERVQESYGLTLAFDDALARAWLCDGMGDSLDAALCAIQAGWAWHQRDAGYGIAANCDPAEGWIVDPAMLG